MSKKSTPRLCGQPTKSASLHPSIVVGGAFVLERCDREVLPTMTVCAYHATPDAVRIVVTTLFQENKELKKALKERGRKA